MRAELPFRLARTAAFAAVCVGLAALAHAMGGGSVPAPHTAALGLGAVLLAALALGGRERSAPAINVALVCAQLGLHELFGTDGTAYVTVAAHPHGRGLGEGVGMLLAHLTATLITGWWLARGESALWALLHRLGHRLVLLRPVAVAVVRQAVPIVIVRIVPVDPVLLHCVARRGPPLPA